jgi:hypothetical protein
MADERELLQPTRLGTIEYPYDVTNEWMFSSGPLKQPHELSSAKARVLRLTLHYSQVVFASAKQ